MKPSFLLAVIVWAVFAASPAKAQKGIEITPFVGGQINGGVDLSTTSFSRLDLTSGLNYGVVGSYPLNNRVSAEFTWNHNAADALGLPAAGGVGQKLFVLHTNQFLGDLLLHLNTHESRLRPFLSFGAGVSNLAADRGNADSITRFTWVFGGGIKYNFSQHFGLRLQAKWTPIYINTVNAGVWCDPFWGGCWEKGDSVFLNQFSGNAGLTFRF